MQHRRPNEIQHGEIPTFLIEHTAPPSPLPFWRRRLAFCSCSMQGAAVAEPEPEACALRPHLHWQGDMIGTSIFFLFLLLRAASPKRAPSQVCLLNRLEP